MLKRHDINLIERHICSFYPNHETPFLMPRRFSPACHLWQACLLIHCFIFKLMFEKNLFHVNGAVWWRWRWRWTKRKSEKKLIAIQLYILLLLAQIILIQGTHQMSWFRASQVGAHTSPVFHSIFGRSTLFGFFVISICTREWIYTERHSSFLFSLQLLLTCIQHILRVHVCMYLINSGETYFQESGCRKSTDFVRAFFGHYICFLFSVHTMQTNKTKRNKRSEKRNCVQHFSQYTMKWVNGLLLIAVHNDCAEGKVKPENICIVRHSIVSSLPFKFEPFFFVRSFFAFLGIVSGSCRWFYSFTWNRQDRESHSRVPKKKSWRWADQTNFNMYQMRA